MGRMSPKALEEAQRDAQRRLSAGQYEADSLYILDDDSLDLAIQNVHSDTDLLTRVDDFVVLAPGWKRCDQCVAMVDEGRSMSAVPLSQPGLVQAFNRKSRQLVKGWAAPETWGTWSEGQDAEIALRVAPDTRSIVIDVLAFVMPPKLTQRVIVSVNGVEVLSTRLTQVQGNLLEIPLNPAVRETLVDGRVVTIQVHLPDATSPRNLGLNDDARVMGLGLKSLTVR
jgi:hypothetical protein